MSGDGFLLAPVLVGLGTMGGCSGTAQQQPGVLQEEVREQAHSGEAQG